MNPVALKYQRIEAFHDDKRKLIANNYDDWELVTGRVGRGKSKWARKNARVLCPNFSTMAGMLAHTHFSEEAFWDDYANLDPGDGVILDEFEGHRRGSMRGERVSFLERMKRTRSRRVHVWIVYDRVSKLDRDLLTDRNAYWSHAEHRGLMQIRQPATYLTFTKESVPIEPTSYPMVGNFDWTDKEPDGWEAAYQKKKDAEMNLFGVKEKAEDPWTKPDPLLAEIIRRRLGL